MYGLYMLRILPSQKPDKAFLRCAWGRHTRRRGERPGCGLLRGNRRAARAVQIMRGHGNSLSGTRPQAVGSMKILPTRFFGPLRATKRCGIVFADDRPSWARNECTSCAASCTWPRPHLHRDQGRTPCGRGVRRTPCLRAGQPTFAIAAALPTRGGSASRCNARKRTDTCRGHLEDRYHW